MLTDDLFDGWLAMPAITSFLEIELPTERQRSSTRCDGRSSEGVIRGTNVSAAPDDLYTDQAYGSRSDRLHGTDKNSPDLLNISSTVAAGVSRIRRGHTKSRLGCITCKKRKIKCQETWPSCANCDKRGVACRYPTIFRPAVKTHPALEPPGPRQIVKLCDTPAQFSSNDLRLFHHYVTAAYPSIPLEHEAIWVRDIPLVSHHTSYLMDAMLALAGSDFAMLVDEPATSALAHRQRAIRGLEEAFSRWPPRAEEAHVMLATSYLLSFQCAFIEDGFLEHILSLRGCALISQLILKEVFDGPFAVQVNMQTFSLANQLERFPHVDQEILREALLSIRAFRPLVAARETSTVERAIVLQFIGTLQPLLENTLHSCKTSKSTSPDLFSKIKKYMTKNTTPYGQMFVQNPLVPRELRDAFDNFDWDNITEALLHRPDALRSFNALMTSLMILANCDYDDLERLFDSSNQLSNIIMAHFLAIRFIVSPLGAPRSAMRTSIGAVVQWMQRIIDAIEDEPDNGTKWTEFVEWPKKILSCMQACTKQTKGMTFAHLYNILMEDPGAFKEGRANKKIAELGVHRLFAPVVDREKCLCEVSDISPAVALSCHNAV